MSISKDTQMIELYHESVRHALLIKTFTTMLTKDVLARFKVTLKIMFLVM